MDHRHSIYDTDPHFKIDPVTRAVKNTSEVKTVIFQHDHNSERFTFELPKMIDGHDMSTCDRVEVHYINVASSGGYKNADIYVVDDLSESPDDPNVIICSWLVSRNATQYAGSLNFILRFVCSGEDGSDVYVWSTAIHTGVTVSNSLNNGDMIVEEYSDILHEWRDTLFAMKSNPPDWNANEGEPGHIENRTHYTEVEPDSILEEITLTEYIPRIPAYFFTGQQELGQPVVGEIYTVWYNGTKYECPCFSLPEGSLRECSFIFGNGIAHSGPTSDAPFLVCGYGSDHWWLESYDLAKSVTLSVSGNGVDTKEIALTEYEEGSYMGVPNHTFIGEQEIGQMMAGETYTVTYNGAEYECQCHSMDGVGVWLGNGEPLGLPASDAPFMIGVNNTHEWSVVAYDMPQSITLSISGNKKIIHKLNSEYLLNGNIENAGDTGIRLKDEGWMEDDDYTPGKYSVALGVGVKASGYGSHAEGSHTTASGEYSHAEGTLTSTEARDAHAEGNNTIAKGWQSHAEGEGTIATGRVQHVEGIYNIVDSYADGGRVRGQYLHIVGNGDSEDNRSNAYTLDWNGRPWSKSRPKFGGTSQLDGTAQEVVANGDLQFFMISPNGSWWRIGVSNDGVLTVTRAANPIT